VAAAKAGEAFDPRLKSCLVTRPLDFGPLSRRQRESLIVCRSHNQRRGMANGLREER
jgi:hypothetical protein